MFTDKLLAVAQTPELRKAIYNRAKALLPFTGSRCATVQSLTYWAAKGVAPRQLSLPDLWPGTDGLDAYLRKNGWHEVRDMHALAPGMVCFTVDKAGRHPAPDHVYLFVRWLDQAQGIAEIFDNYSAALTIRNLLPVGTYKGKRYARTPWQYALVPPV